MIPTGTSSYRGFYINLDRSPDRRARMEDQLRRFGLGNVYERFPAIDGRNLTHSSSQLRPGEIGVFLSHHGVLKRARGLGKCVHVVEDDVLLSRHVGPVLEEAIAENVLEHFDLLFTDSVVNCHLGLMKNLTAAFDQVRIPESGPLRTANLTLMDLATVFYAAFQSYVVGARSIERLLALYEQEIAGGIKTPIDIFVQQQVLSGRLRAACLFPFLTSSRIEDHISGSTIADEGERAGRPSVMVMSVLRYLFFVDRDLDYAKRLLDAATLSNRTKTSQHHDLLMQVTEFVMSKDFQES